MQTAVKKSHDYGGPNYNGHQVAGHGEELILGNAYKLKGRQPAFLEQFSRTSVTHKQIASLFVYLFYLHSA